MDMIRSILALLLLAAISWIASYTVCLMILTQSQWSPRLHLDQRFPPHRFRKINRVMATIVGLIIAGAVIYSCAPAAITPGS